MNTARRAFLKSVMDLAWGLYRADLDGPAPRSFADALSGAWRFMGRSAERAAADRAFMARNSGHHVAFGSMLQSPIRRALRGQAYAGASARSAGYVTSMIGG